MYFVATTFDRESPVADSRPVLASVRDLLMGAAETLSPYCVHAGFLRNPDRKARRVPKTPTSQHERELCRRCRVLRGIVSVLVSTGKSPRPPAFITAFQGAADLGVPRQRASDASAATTCLRGT